MNNNEPIQRLSKEERETILTYNEADNFWTIYSGVQPHIRKFDKLNFPVTDTEYYPDGEVAGKFYKVPKNAISFRDISKKRQMSEEERQKKSQMMKEFRQKQIDSKDIKK